MWDHRQILTEKGYGETKRRLDTNVHPIDFFQSKFLRVIVHDKTHGKDGEGYRDTIRMPSYTQQVTSSQMGQIFKD